MSLDLKTRKVRKLAKGEAISASRDKAGVLEILVVVDSGVMQSRDNGASFTPLKA